MYKAEDHAAGAQVTKSSRVGLNVVGRVPEPEVKMVFS